VARDGAAGTPGFRIFTVDAGVETRLVGLTIVGGRTDSGGGISNVGTLTVTGCTLTGNRAVGHDGHGTTRGRRQ
jgi:hypothetical protein